MDLHAEDARISEDESERNGDDNSHDKGLKICRTVTQVKKMQILLCEVKFIDVKIMAWIYLVILLYFQVVPAEVQENGQEEDEVVYQNQSEEASTAVAEPAPVEVEPPPSSEPEVKNPLPESPVQAEVRGKVL